jgi:hypothetical protein
MALNSWYLNGKLVIGLGMHVSLRLKMLPPDDFFSNKWYLWFNFGLEHVADLHRELSASKVEHAKLAPVHPGALAAGV